MTNNITKRIKGKPTQPKKTGTYKIFEKIYKPIENCFGEVLYEAADLSRFDVNQIWTIVEGDNFHWYICAGLHLVNRTGYYIICEYGRGDGYHADYLYV